MFGLTFIDILVVVLYFAVIIGIGVWSSRRISSQEDYFLAGRRFGKLIQTFAAFGQGTSADNAVGVTTTTFTNGAAGIWSSLLYLFATPWYWMVAPWMRRLRLLTLGDFFTERYGSRKMGAAYAIIGAVGMMSFIALGFSAMTKTIVAIVPKDAAEFSVADREEYVRAAAIASRVDGGGTVLSYDELVEREQLEALQKAGPIDEAQEVRLLALQTKKPAMTISHLRHDVVIWLVCFIVMIYAVLGGLEAAFLTDMLQGVFIILLSLILIPFGWAKINAIHGGSGMMGALRTIHEQLPEASFEIFGSPQTVDFTWYYILVLSIMAAITVVIQPNSIVAMGSARDEYSARYGFMVGNLLKRMCTVFWGVFGLAAIVLYSNKVQHSDLVWGFATRDLLGPLGFGLVGLMIACLMAALMSTVDCLMLTCSSLLTHNLYALLAPNRSQGHYVWAGRFFGAIVVIGGAWIALQFDTILQILKFIWEINVMVAPAFWLGMKWRRANRKGAWASIVLGALAFLFIPVLLPVAMPMLRTNEVLLKRTNPAPIVRTYVARETDRLERLKEIAVWNALGDSERAGTMSPTPLVSGQEFEKTYQLPRKGIFWTQGVKPNEEGVLSGRGALSLELVVLDRLGLDLTRNPYAFNETLRILIRTFLPFVIMILVSFFTSRDDAKRLNRFYARMRTKVLADHEADERELALSLENVDRHDDCLMFPHSNWEFYKLSREDTVGFAASVGAALGILLLMTVLVNLGS